MNDDHIMGSHDGAPLAAEYVLGVLGAAERREFEQRMTIEPALRAEVEYWERRLGGLAFEVKPVDPPPQHWANIEAALNRSEVSPALRGGLWNSLTFWRWSLSAAHQAQARRWSPSSTSAAAKPGSSPRSTRRATA
jgi:anti-sigma-K factor RskA